jgi:hypothetical protein
VTVTKEKMPSHLAMTNSGWKERGIRTVQSDKKFS